MATLAQIADELSSSPAASMSLPAAELGLLVGEREHRLSAMVAARDQAAADLGMLDQRATSLLPAIGPDVMLQVSRSRAQEIVLAANQAAASVLTGLGSFEPRAVLASIVAEQYERPMREFALTVDSFARPAQEAARQFVESFSSLAGLGDMLLSPADLAGFADMGQPSGSAKQALEQFYADEQRHERERQALLSQFNADERRHERERQALARYLEDDQRAASRAERYLLAELPDVDQMVDALWARRAPAVHVTQVGALVEIEPVAWPPPQSGNFGIPPAQPGQPGGELLAIAHDILSGRVNSREQVVKRLLMIEQGNQQPPQWEYIELIALDYERNGHRYQNMTAFAAKHRLSRATVANYLKHYEAATGKQVRPGQGRAKRGGKWQQ